MTPAELLTAARDLVEAPRAATAATIPSWAPRAATILARQALEQAMTDVLKSRAPGSQAAPFTVRLLVLGEVLGDRDLAARTSYVWSALGAASHQQGYELPPTDKELRRWLAVVAELVEGG
jgi:hypothetical protein